MNKIYEKNLKVFEKKYPDIYDEMTSKKEEKKDKDNEPKVRNFTVKYEKIDDRNVLYLEYADKVTQLESLYDNTVINEIWTNNVLKDIKINTKILLFGIGNISFVRALVKKMPEDSKLYIYEPDQDILKILMEIEDITDVIRNRSITLVLGTCMKDSIRNTYERFFGFSDVYNYINITSLNYNTIYPDEYKEYSKGLEMTLSTVASNFGFYSNAGKYSNKNTFKNIKYILDSKSLVELGKKIDNDIPAIIVAAGPSLAKNIKYLHEAKGKAIIIAIDAAMRALAREGITPDLCVTVDFNKELGHFDEGDSKDVPLVCSLLSTSEFVKENRGSKLFYLEDTPYFNQFLDRNKITMKSLPTGGTVANNALSAAINMGCKTIIIIGQDLAFTNNQTHAPGTVKGDMKLAPEAEGGNCYIEDMDGNPIMTSGEFILYKQWIEETVKTRSEIHFINATEGGAGLKGCEHIPFKEAINRECKKEINVAEIIRETPNLFTNDQRRRFIEHTCRIPEKFKRLSADAREGVLLYEKMIRMINSNTYNSPEFAKLYKNAKKCNNRINKNSVTYMVFNEIQHEMNENMKTIYDDIQPDEKTELLFTCKKGKESFERIESASNQLCEFVKEQIAVCFSEE